MRIISGTYGGRKLKKVPDLNTRSTSDQIKETMFNIIGPYFKGGNVLDLYAGSGALGIEAVSRGMDQAVLVDHSKKACHTISENIKVTKESFKFKVINKSAETALDILENDNKKFTLVFLDPPYAAQSIIEDIEKMISQNFLEEVAVVVCEVAREVKLPEKIEEIKKWDERNFGNKKIVIYQKN